MHRANNYRKKSSLPSNSSFFPPQYRVSITKRSPSGKTSLRHGRKVLCGTMPPLDRREKNPSIYLTQKSYLRSIESNEYIRAPTGKLLYFYIHELDYLSLTPVTDDFLHFKDRPASDAESPCRDRTLFPRQVKFRFPKGRFRSKLEESMRDRQTLRVVSFL